MKPNITGLNQTGFRASSEPLSFGTFSVFGLSFGSLGVSFFEEAVFFSGELDSSDMLTILQVGFD